jgi:hypothetical protein
MTELVQYFAYRGSSHRRKGSAIRIIDMVLLYHSTTVSQREGLGGILLDQMKLILPAF